MEEGETNQGSFYHVFLNFDWDLNLVAHVKSPGIVGGRSLRAISSSSIVYVCFYMDANTRDKMFYLIDVEERTIRLLYRYPYPVFSEEGTWKTDEMSGRIWNTYHNPWSIERFFLN